MTDFGYTSVGESPASSQLKENTPALSFEQDQFERQVRAAKNRDETAAPLRTATGIISPPSQGQEQRNDVAREIRTRHFEAEVRASWERVFLAHSTIRDVNSHYRKHFQSFIEELHRDGQHTTLFSQPNWPERAMELRNQKYGPIPIQFR